MQEKEREPEKVQSNLESRLKLQPPRTKLKILTYNIFIMPGSIFTKNKDYKEKRLQIFSKSLKQFTIINFQELHSKKSRKSLIEEAIKSGYKYIAKPKKQPMFSKYKRGSGLLTISKHKILRTGFQPFTKNLSQFYHGVMYSQIRISNEEDKIIHIFNTQFQSTEAKKYKSKDKRLFKTRLQQIIQAREIIEHYLGKYSEVFERWQKNNIILFTGNFSLNARRCYLPVTDMNIGEIDNEKEDIRRWIQENKKENPVVDEEGVFSEYEFLKFVLSGYGKDTVKDLVFELMNFDHPVTYGDCFNKNRKTIPRETLLTSKIGRNSEKCLDYFLQIIPRRMNIQEDERKFYCKILPFFVNQEEEKDCEVTQLSNHYGVRIDLEI